VNTKRPPRAGGFAKCVRGGERGGPHQVCFCFEPTSPRIMRGVGYRLFSVSGDGDGELNRLAIRFLERIGVREDTPVQPAVEMLDDANRHGFFLVVADFYLEGLVQCSFGTVNVVRGSTALAYEVEGISGVDADSLTSWRVIDDVLAGELNLTIIVSPIEAQASLGQRNAELVCLRIQELPHDPDLGVGFGAI